VLSLSASCARAFCPRTPLYAGEAAQSLVLRFVYREIEGTAKEIKKLEFSYADAGVEEEWSGEGNQEK